MKVNLAYNNSGPRTPSGATPNQTVASLTGVGVFITNPGISAGSALTGNPYAASTIISNGESIGNAQLTSNPIPPGV